MARFNSTIQRPKKKSPTICRGWSAILKCEETLDLKVKKNLQGLRNLKGEQDLRGLRKPKGH
jgi:hypothetical protein